MLKLIIEDDEGRKTIVPFVREEITIGRQEGNTVRLVERNISRHHARLVRQSGHVVVEDLDSYNGVRINGERIQGSSLVHDGDLIQIGDYDLALQTDVTPQLPSPQSEEEDEEESSEPLVVGTLEEPSPEPAPVRPRPRTITTSVIRADQVEQNRPRKVVDLDSSEAPRLVVISSELEGREFICSRTELRIGRTEDNDIPLEHRSLSRLHAKLVRENNGEWRILDMQSANGLKVNGESYAQATLSQGDVIELGHVRLRFVGPGESTAEMPYTERGERRSRSSTLALVLGAVVLVGALVLVGLWWALRESSVPPPEPAEVHSTALPPEPPAPPPEQEQLQEQLAQARKAREEGDLTAALALLEPLQDAAGQRPAEVEQLLTELRAEQQAAQQPPEPEREPPAAPRQGTPAEADPGPAARRPLEARRLSPEQAEQLYSNARALYDKRRYEEAVQALQPCKSAASCRLLLGATYIKLQQFKKAVYVLQRCNNIGADYLAECNLALGTAYGELKQPEDGAKYYSRFLLHAPATHPRVSEVRKYLLEYNKQRPANPPK